jgi:hypothetical protein
MHTPFLPWCFFLILSWHMACLLWRAGVDDISAVAASDNWRLRGCGCVFDRAVRDTWWPLVIVNIWLLLLQLSVREPVIGTAAADICLRGYLLLWSHACTLISGVWRVQKKGIALRGAIGVHVGQ